VLATQIFAALGSERPMQQVFQQKSSIADRKVVLQLCGAVTFRSRACAPRGSRDTAANAPKVLNPIDFTTALRSREKCQ
jgi:hypothetical protein